MMESLLWIDPTARLDLCARARTRQRRIPRAFCLLVLSPPPPSSPRCGAHWLKGRRCCEMIATSPLVFFRQNTLVFSLTSTASFGSTSAFVFSLVTHHHHSVALRGPLVLQVSFFAILFRCLWFFSDGRDDGPL